MQKPKIATAHGRFRPLMCAAVAVLVLTGAGPADGMDLPRVVVSSNIGGTDPDPEVAEGAAGVSRWRVEIPGDFATRMRLVR